jgi:transcriptional regulator with XRE-family HTH domain
MRRLKGWSQEEVAEKLDMSANGYGGIERGDTDVSFSKLEKIAAVFDIDVTELIKLNDTISCNQIVGGNNTNYQHYYGNLSEVEQLQLKNELEKYQLMNQSKDKEIEHLKQQLSQLQEIIALLKKGNINND